MEPRKRSGRAPCEYRTKRVFVFKTLKLKKNLRNRFEAQLDENNRLWRKKSRI